MDAMMDDEAQSITNVVHKKFKYIYIPEDINNDVQEFTFEGKEKNFQNKIKQFFNSELLNKNEKSSLMCTLGEKVEGKMNDEQLSNAVECSYTYQIIPLTLPTAKTNFEGVNAYIDNIGRIKNLNTNARATRLCSQDIRGGCFLSKTFDDENDFKRIDFSKNDYELFLKNPPSADGRWSEANTMKKLLQNAEKINEENLNEKIEKENKVRRCENCRKTENEVNIQLKRCSGCSKVFYCDAECQKSDWIYHRRVCIK